MLKNERIDEEVNLMNMKFKVLFGTALMYAPILVVTLDVLANPNIRYDGFGGFGGFGGFSGFGFPWY